MSVDHPSKPSQRGWIAWFVNNPVAANLLMLVILALGIATALGLRIEGFPSTDPFTVTIDVAYDSGDPRQAEEGIAIKVEKALQGMSGVQSISSSSTSSGSTIRVERIDGYDLNQLNAEIKIRVDEISGFPATAENPVVSQQQWEDSALWISVFGDVEQKSLQSVAGDLENALLSLPSVKKITRSGWRTEEIAIEVDEAMLQAHDLTLDELVQIIRDESLAENSGELRSGNGVILLKADKQRYFYQDFAKLVVRTYPDGSQLRLADIARVEDGFAESPNILSRFQGKAAVNLEIRVDRDDNIVHIAQQAKELVQSWQQGQRLPQGVALDLWWDQSQGMLDRLGLVLENGLVGIVLVMLVLSVFLNVKVAFWVGMGLPICFAGGLILMGSGFFDLTLNQLTTFGFVLVLGILVDDAVVVGESIYTARQTHGDSTESTVLGVQRVAVPTVYGLLTTVAAFYPLSLVEGRLGSIFSQFALVCTACLLFSLLESKLILPAHLSHLKTHKDAKRGWLGRGMFRLQCAANGLLDQLRVRIYRPALARAIAYRYATVWVFFAIFVVVIGLVPSGKVKFNFFPDIPEEIVSVFFSVESDKGYAFAHQQADKVEAAVAKLNAKWQSQNVSEDAVMAKTYTLVADDKSGVVTIELSPKDQRPIAADAIAAALQQELKQSEGLQELLVSTDDHEDKDFELSLLSDNPEQLREAAARIQAHLAATEGVSDVFNNMAVGQTQLTFELTPEGRALGMTTAMLSRQIQQHYFGAEVQRIQRGREEIKVRVRYPAEQRQDVTSLQETRIRTPQGRIVALSTVASIRQGYSVTEINRVNGRRAASLSANIDESKVEASALMESLEEGIFRDIKAKYPDIQLLSEGDLEQEEAGKNSLLMIFVFSLFCIYALVAIPLKSYWQPLVIMSVIPFGVVGALLGHWVGDLAFSILSINGVLALSGVVVNDSLLLVCRFNELVRSGLPYHQALVEAGSQRMRAIVLTSMTTCLGLVSLLQETSEQAQFLIPAATSLAYGIGFATLISLVLVPVLLAIAEDIKQLLGGSHSVSQEPREALV